MARHKNASKSPEKGAVPAKPVTETVVTEVAPSLPVRSNGIALYYPYVNVQDPNWLKMALLYWDGIRRIVPEHTYVEDAVSCRPALDADLLSSTPPGPYVAGAARRFRNLLDPQVGAGAQMLEAFQIAAVEARERGTLENVYLEKLDWELAQWLQEQRVAYERGDEMLMGAAAATAYMTCLAAEMSVAIGAPTVTDQLAVAECVQYVVFGRRPRRRWSKAKMPVQQANPVIGNPPYLDAPGPLARSVRLTLDLPNPEALANVSFDQIFRFRDRYADERRRLRDEVERILAPVPSMQDGHQIADYLRDQQRRVDQAYVDHRKACDRFYAAAVPAVLTISVPVAVTSVAHALGASVSAEILGVGAAGWSLVGMRARFNQDRAKLLESPYHYLTTVDRLVRR